MEVMKVGNRFSSLLMAMPFVCVALAGGAWIEYGLDFPWYDDWRGYQNGNIDSLRLSYLFSPINDTLSPVGLALDAVFQRLFSGNSIVYQLISMFAILIGLLIIQLDMLRKVLADDRHVTLCFLLTLPMLQPGSYWGAQNLAYHQAIPVLLMLSAIWVVIFSHLRNHVKLPVLGILGLISGFSYISGALVFFACGVAFLFFSFRFEGGVSRRLFYSSIPLLLSGLFTSLIQLVFAFSSFGMTHSKISLAYPNQANFWLYLLGKVGRGLLLPTAYPWIAFFATIGFVIAVAALSVVVFNRLTCRCVEDSARNQAGLIFFVLLVAIGSYILMVAAGRANYYSNGSDRSLAAFVAGFDRFHFFWLTILWPWVLAVFLINSQKVFAIAKSSLFYLLAICFATVMYFGGVWQHESWHQRAMQIRKSVFDCFVKSLNEGRGIRCEQLLPDGDIGTLPDATPAYLHALRVNASFLRYVPRVDDLARSSELMPFFTIDGAYGDFSLDGLTQSADGSFTVVGDSPKLYVRNIPSEIMRQCVRLDVVVRISAESNGYFQLFFRRPSDSNYEEIFSKKANLKSLSVNDMEFKLTSVDGFMSEIRIDPAKNLRNFKIKNIAVYCALGHAR